MKPMFGRKKYHIAILDRDPGFVTRMVNALQEWYSNRIVVNTYTDSNSMFFDMNLAAAKHSPFDVAIMKPDELPISMILKRTNPSLKVVMCEDEQKLKQQTSELLG